MITARAAASVALLLLSACADPALESAQDPKPLPNPGSPPAATYFTDVGSTSLPATAINETCMDAAVGDVDEDGDLDIVLAIELGQNRLLLNAGDGTFEDQSALLPVAVHDSEDAVLADFNADGHLDLIFVSEDDLTNEYYLGDGTGAFTAAPAPLPVDGVSNAAVAFPTEPPGLLIGNAGENVLLQNDGMGALSVSGAMLPITMGITQDVELGDIDGDGDLDVYVANEGADELWIQDAGNFTDEASIRLPPLVAETREADFGDVDGDGDLDIILANVRLFSELPAANVLLINDGSGVFSQGVVPSDAKSSFDADFADIDGDGDLDIILADASFEGDPGGVRIWRNQTGSESEERFADASSVLVPAISDQVFDIEAHDFNGDGVLDIYVCSRGVVGLGARDHLLLGPAPTP